MSSRTPLGRVKGMGSSHSGTGHFWRERITAAALAPLSLWFAYVAIGLSGTTTSAPLQFFAQPVNAILMAASRGVRLEGMMIVSTYEPCISCRKHIKQAGLTIAPAP